MWRVVCGQMGAVDHLGGVLVLLGLSSSNVLVRGMGALAINSRAACRVSSAGCAETTGPACGEGKCVLGYGTALHNGEHARV